MPYENTWEHRGYYSRFWGIVPKWEIDAMNHQFSSDPRSDKTIYQIFDGSEIEAFDFSEREIPKIASNDIGLETYLKNISVALVGSKPEIREAYQQYVEICQRINKTWDFRLFHTLAEARAWTDTLVPKK